MVPSHEESPRELFQNCIRPFPWLVLTLWFVLKSQEKTTRMLGCNLSSNLRTSGRDLFLNHLGTLRSLFACQNQQRCYELSSGHGLSLVLNNADGIVYVIALYRYIK